MAKWETSDRYTGESFSIWEDWLRRKAPSTEMVYKRNMLKFLEFIDSDTESLFIEHLGNVRESKRDEGDPRALSRVPRKVSALMDQMVQEKGLSGSTAFQVAKSVGSFFKANSLEFALNGYTPNLMYEKGKDRITKEQIKALMDHTGDLRNLAMIAVLKDTGLRVSDLVQIRVKHIRPVIEQPELEFHTFEMNVQKTTRKTGVKANPVIGPDACHYIRLWWERRKSFDIGEDDSDFLFCKIKNKTPYEKKVQGVKRLMGGSKKGDPLDSNTISPLFTRLIRKAGFEEANISAHSFRKFFETKMQVSGVPDAIIDKYTGRAMGYKGTYVKPLPNELIEPYIGAYRELILEDDISQLSKTVDFERAQRQQLENRLRELERANQFLWKTLEDRGDPLASKITLDSVTTPNGEEITVYEDITQRLREGERIELTPYIMAEDQPKPVEDSKDQRIQNLENTLAILMKEIGELKKK